MELEEFIKYLSDDLKKYKAEGVSKIKIDALDPNSDFALTCFNSDGEKMFAVEYYLSEIEHDINN